jgi:RNA-directed DNA polymerase
MMHGQGKSDGPIVPGKPPNKPAGAEGVEGRGSAKGNPHERTMLRTQGRARMQQALERVRQAAKQDRKMRFTALLHHVYNPDTLREAYHGLKREAAPGLDGVTWQDYGRNLEANLQDLAGRLKRGAYRAKPTRRAYIDKANGRKRPLGVMALEDKIVQRAAVEVLNAIYEVDFLGFSYGFRPGRSPHRALDALYVAQLTRKVNWVLDADICGFFDAIDRTWLVKFIEHRIGDRRVVRLIQKWLNAGVLEEGERIHSERGTVQGGNISPLLANVYLHYVFDLWVQQWRRTQARGEVMVVRYADDFIVGFQHKEEAERFIAELRERFAKFGLVLHSEKTRLIEFGPWAAENRRRKGQGKPQTFEFLGFTHICGRKRSNGYFTVYRQSMRTRLQAKVAEVKAELRRRMCHPVPEVGTWLATVLTGHYRYYGVPMNTKALWLFRYQVGWLWRRTLSRRSQKGRLPWERMARLIDRYLPKPQIYHDYPLRRFGVIT